MEKKIRYAISKLKNNKACGQDSIANEYIKASIDTMLPAYLLLFNLALFLSLGPLAQYNLSIKITFGLSPS